jgi:tctex1 domain-containing protein 2
LDPQQVLSFPYRFSPSVVKKIIEDVLKGTLEGKTWNGEEETVWTVSISEQIKQKVKELDYPRYKLVVQVIIGENKLQGVRIASRCLWDHETDNLATAAFKNVSGSVVGQHDS